MNGGAYGGGPYWGELNEAYEINDPSKHDDIVKEYVEKISQYAIVSAKNKLIDPKSSMRKAPVYVSGCEKDLTVSPMN